MSSWVKTRRLNKVLWETPRGSILTRGCTFELRHWGWLSCGCSLGPSGQDSGSTLRGRAGGWWWGGTLGNPRATVHTLQLWGCCGRLFGEPAGSSTSCRPQAAWSAPPLHTGLCSGASRDQPSPLTLALFSVRKVNDWQSDWVTFYARQRIQPQMELLEQGSGDREARELWAALQVSVAPCPRPPCAAGLREALRPV